MTNERSGKRDEESKSDSLTTVRLGVCGGRGPAAEETATEQQARAVQDGDEEGDDEEEHVGDAPWARLPFDDAGHEVEAGHGHLHQHEDRVPGAQTLQAHQLREHHRELREQAACRDAHDVEREHQDPTPSDRIFIG